MKIILTCKGKPGGCGRTYDGTHSTLWQCPYCHCTLDVKK